MNSVDTTELIKLIHSAESLQYSNQDSSIIISNIIISEINQTDHELSLQATYIKANSYFQSGYGDTAMIILQNLLKISKECGNDFYEVKSLNIIGLIHLKKGNYNTAIEFIQKSGEKANEYNIPEREAASHNNLGLIYRELGLYDKSLEALKKANELYTNLKDTSAVVTVKNNMGLVFKDIGDLDGAMKHYIKALGLANELQDQDLKSMLYLNIGVLYNLKKDFDQSIYYFEKSLKLKEILNLTYDKAIIYSDLGEVWFNKGEIKKSIEYYNRALEIYEKLGSLKDKINVHCCIANAYTVSGKYNEAKKHIEISDELIRGKEEINNKLFFWISRTKMNYYEKTGNYKEALKYSKLYKNFDDSLHISSVKDKIAQQKILYELDFKEHEIEKLKTNNELNKIKTLEQEQRLKNNNYIMSGILFIFIIGFILLYFLFRQVRMNKKINKTLQENRRELLDKNYEITQQNEEIKAQSDQLFEVNEDLMQLKSAINETDNAVVILDKYGNFEWGNKGFDRLYEIPFKEFKKIYPNILDALKPHRNAEEIYKVIKNCLDNQVPGSYEFSDMSKKGEIVWIHTNIRAVTDFKGEVQNIIMIDTDVTEKVRTRKMLELKNHELKKQQAKIQAQSKQLHNINIDLLQFKAAVNETDNAIMILDPKGYYIWGNKGFENLYGISFREFIKKYPNILDTHETSVNRINVLNVIKSCIYNKTPGNFEFTIFKNDEKLWIQSSIKAVSNSKGEVQSLIVIDTDISEKVKTTRLMEIKNYELERQREEIDASLRYAQNIQKAILPAPLNMRKNNDFFLIYMPKDIVSGDFYWFSDRKDCPYTYFAVVDCTGHGVPGAFMSMIGARILNTVVNEKNIFMPSQILEEMHTSVKIALRQKLSGNRDGMDVSLVRIEKEGNSVKEVVFSGAMQSIFYYNKAENKLQKLRGDVKSIGGHYYDEVNFTDKIIKLHQDDVLYLFSDGYIDQDSPEGKKIGSAKLTTVLKKIASNPLIEQKDHLLKAFNNHKKDENQRDDITFLGIKIR